MSSSTCGIRWASCAGRPGGSSPTGSSPSRCPTPRARRRGSWDATGSTTPRRTTCTTSRRRPLGTSSRRSGSASPPSAASRSRSRSTPRSPSWRSSTRASAASPVPWAASSRRRCAPASGRSRRARCWPSRARLDAASPRGKRSPPPDAHTAHSGPPVRVDADPPPRALAHPAAARNPGPGGLDRRRLPLDPRVHRVHAPLSPLSRPVRAPRRFLLHLPGRAHDPHLRHPVRAEPPPEQRRVPRRPRWADARHERAHRPERRRSQLAAPLDRRQPADHPPRTPPRPGHDRRRRVDRRQRGDHAGDHDRDRHRGGCGRGRHRRYRAVHDRRGRAGTTDRGAAAPGVSARASNAASPGERVASAAVFLALVGLAGGLRFWGIHQSLPLVTGRPDEREILQYTAGFPAGDLNPRWFIYPNLYFYVVFAWERLVLAVRGLWLSTSDYGLTLRTALPSLILYGRWLSALAGTLTVPAVWAIGRRLGGEGIGLAAAALLVSDFLHVRDSHTLKPDTLLALGVLVSIWLLARWREHPGRRGSIAAGLAIGLTTGIKYPGVLLLFPAWVADPRAGPRGIGRLLPSVGLLALVAAV